MSIFSQDLDKGGTLGDVVSIRDIRYPSGESLAIPHICARDTTQSSVNSYNGCSSDLFFPVFREFDNESDGILTPQGFYCNRGFIEYKHLFTKEVLNDLMETNSNLGLRSLLTNSILRGNIETLFIPFTSFNIAVQKPKNKRFIYDYEWWKLVETSIKDGINKCIDPSWRTHLYVRMYGYTHTSHTFKCSFYITIKICGHDVYGDVYWSTRDDYQHGQLFHGINESDPNKIEIEVGSPISISTRVDMEYIGVLDSKE